MKQTVSQDKMRAWNSLIADGDLTSIQSRLGNENLSTKDKLGQYELSPLHLAAWHNKPEICQFLISQKVSPSVKESFSQKTPLHIAAYFGHVEAAEELINLGAKISGGNSRDILGCHPLFYAALGEQKQMLFLFLGLAHLKGPHSLGPDFTAKTVSCIGNILDILIRKKNFALCDLISSSVGISIVETNPRRESRLYIGYRNENPWTPFHSAAVLGDKAVVEMLLKKFPYAYCLCEDFSNLFDYSPGDVALIEGHDAVAKMFGETKTIADCRRNFNHFSLRKNAPEYAENLLQALLERNYDQLDRLIDEYGENILYQRDFEESDRTFYREHYNLNALSIISRLFCVSFSDWVERKKIEINHTEFFERDLKELVFFNWSMINVHPYATAFFEKIQAEMQKDACLSCQ